MLKKWVRLVGMVVSIFLFVSLSLGGSFKELDSIAMQALQEYFLSSDRPIQKIQLGQLSILSQKGQDYLLEAEVVAKASFDDRYAYYHCGVFLKRLSLHRWQVELTTCEAYILPSSTPR